MKKVRRNLKIAIFIAITVTILTAILISMISTVSGNTTEKVYLPLIFGGSSGFIPTATLVIMPTPTVTATSYPPYPTATPVIQP